jgi:hypothetical protein
MKSQSLNKMYAFIILIMMLFALPEFTIAQKKSCPAGKILVCDETGKHCTCAVDPRPCRGCGLLIGSQTIAINSQSENIGAFSVEMFDFTGRLVKTFSDINIQQGDQINWNLADEKGNGVATGVYVLQFSDAHICTTQKILLVD